MQGLKRTIPNFSHLHPAQPLEKKSRHVSNNSRPFVLNPFVLAQKCCSSAIKQQSYLPRQNPLKHLAEPSERGMLCSSL